MEYFFSNINLIALLIKWKKHISIVIILAIILSWIFSSPLFIKPKYKSKAIIYPANILPYSDESETEQMLQIIQSADIRDSIIKKFNLAKHYEIDSSYEYFYSTMVYLYNENVNIKKTEYESVNIEVLDIDPNIACEMIKSMFYFYNIKVKKLHKEKFGEVIINYKKQIERKAKYLDSLKDALNELGAKYGLLDYKAQSREITKSILEKDGYKNNKNIQNLKQNIEQKGGDIIKLEYLIEAESKTYGELSRDYDNALLQYNRDYTFINIISQPFPADRKSYPIRWMIVMFSTLAAGFLSIIVIAIIENKNKIKEIKTN